MKQPKIRPIRGRFIKVYDTILERFFFCQVTGRVKMDKEFGYYGAAGDGAWIVEVSNGSSKFSVYWRDRRWNTMEE